MNKPIGLILAGGQSKRMGRAKAWINYNGQPQVDWLHEMLRPFCSEIILSINEMSNSAEQFNCQPDLPLYAGHGPISGVLSAFENTNQALLVVGCDYPYLDVTALQLLMDARNVTSCVTCFTNKKGFVEPLIACYELEAKVQMQAYFNAGYDSLSRFIIGTNAQLIQCTDPRILLSADSPDFEFVLKK